MSVDILASKFVQALGKELSSSSGSNAIKATTYITFRAHVKTVFTELDHALLRQHLLQNLDKYTSTLWTQYSKAKKFTSTQALFSPAAFAGELARLKYSHDNVAELVSLSLIPGAPSVVRNIMQDALVNSNVKPAEALTIMIHASSSAMTADSNDDAMDIIMASIQQMNCVTAILSAASVSELPYSVVCSYINHVVSRVRESKAFLSLNLTQTKHISKQFLRSLISLFTVALRSMPTSEPESSTRSFLTFVSAVLERLPTGTSTLAAHSTDIVEALLENVTLVREAESNSSGPTTLPDASLLLRLPAVIDVLLSGLLSRDTFASGAASSPLRNPFSALRLARVLRSFSQLSPLLRAIAPTLTSAPTLGEVKTAIIGLGKVLQKHAHHAGSLPLPTSLVSTLPRLISKPTEAGMTVQAALSGVSKNTFSFLLRSGQCSVTDKKLMMMIRKLRVMGLSALTTHAEAEEAAEKKAKRQKISKDGESESDNDDESDNFIGLYADDDLAEEDVNMMADDDLFYVDVGGDADVREELNSLIEQTKTENDLVVSIQRGGRTAMETAQIDSDDEENVSAENGNEDDDNEDDMGVNSEEELTQREQNIADANKATILDDIVGDEAPSMLEQEMETLLADISSQPAQTISPTVEKKVTKKSATKAKSRSSISSR